MTAITAGSIRLMTCEPWASALRRRASKMSEARSMDPTLVDLPIGIRAETSLADPDTCKFTVSRTLHPGGPFFFGTMERAAGSPLGERLFALPGVANVLIAESVVTIGKEPSASWSALKAAIGTAIRAHLLTGVPAILEMAVYASAQGRSDAELSAAVQELLDKEVNRSIANHGGENFVLVNRPRGPFFTTKRRAPGGAGPPSP